MEAIPVGFRFYKQTIADVAKEYSLPASVVAAMVWKESSFNADAFRFEQDFWNRYLKRNPLYNTRNPRQVSSSYGLMQVMYCRVQEDKIVANDHLPPEHLFEPAENLRVGCCYLRELIDWALRLGVTADVALTAALAAYNGGRGGNHPLKDNPLRNGYYARDVLSRQRVMEKEYAS